PIRGASDVAWFGNLLERLNRGAVTDVALAVPRQVTWSLPIRELAMLTASWLREGGRTDRRITVVTHEQAPLEVLGGSVSARIAELLSDRGVDLVAGAGPVRFEQGRLVCEGGKDVRADEAVALPGPSVP